MRPGRELILVVGFLLGREGRGCVRARTRRGIFGLVKGLSILIRVKASQLPDDNDAMLKCGLVGGEGEKVGGMGVVEELYATRASGCEQVVLSGSV